MNYFIIFYAYTVNWGVYTVTSQNVQNVKHTRIFMKQARNGHE